VPSKPIKHKPRVVLIVDGNVLVRLALADFLRRCGFKVIEARTAADCMTVLGEPAVHVDLVFCEVALPDATSGFSLAWWIRARRPALPVVLSSSLSRKIAQAGEICEQLGAARPSPYDLGELERQIRRALSGRRDDR